MDYPESRPKPSGLTAEGASLFASAHSSAAEKKDDWWTRAEGQTAELIDSIKPTQLSEKRREDVTDFVERLIRDRFDCEVMKFGSVPLKTYLPDGDIDLYVFARNDLRETWAQDVVKALKQAEDDVGAKYRVKEVQYIQAEVKLIKCLVDNIVVDISFNQTGGLSTLCFLERVDEKIGLNHLFKRSVILVKAWCYYESRILGAHHGLISTYALETLVLYIFHVFHSMKSLHGPLEVLYLFLIYFCNFDWDHYCLSIWGPVPLPSEAEKAREPSRKDVEWKAVAKPPWEVGGKLLLNEEFIEECIKKYSDIQSLESSHGRIFNFKYLNILDPIRHTNNLGRSVNVGSFKRIRSAFGLGARTLGEVLECPKDQITEKLKSFFSCTFKSLERYHSSGRPDSGIPHLRGLQHPISGAGSAYPQERLSGGYRQENGADLLPTQSPLTAGENIRAQLQYGSWPARLNDKPRSDLDVPDQSNDMQNDSTHPSTIGTSLSDSSGRGDGNITDTVSSAVDNKQTRGTEAGSVKAVFANPNVVYSDEQLRQAGGRGRYTYADPDAARVQTKGPHYYPPQEHLDRSVNRRYGEEHDPANRSKTLMVGEHQTREPSSDPIRLKTTLSDSVRRGDVYRSRNSFDRSLAHSNLDQRESSGPSGEFKTDSSHGNFQSKAFADDESASSLSRRIATEESKITYDKRGIHQKNPPFLGDGFYQGHSQDRVNHTVSQPLSYSNLDPHVQLLPHVHPVQMYLAVPTATPTPVTGLAGPLSDSNFRATHFSCPSGDSALNRATSHSPTQISSLPSTFSATPAYTVSVGTVGDSAGSPIGGFSFHTEEQQEQHRSRLEEQTQLLKRVSVSPNASSSRSVFIGNPPVSIGSAIPFFGGFPVLSQASGKLSAASRGRGSTVGMAGSQKKPPAHGCSSLSSLNDEGQRAASSNMDERAHYLEPGSKNRENMSNSSKIKVSEAKPLKDENGNKQPSRKSKSYRDECEMEVVRSVDGNATELPLPCFSQGSLEDASIASSQASQSHVSAFTSAHSYEELVPKAVPNNHRSSSVHSVTLEPAEKASYQSFQAATNQAGFRSNPTSSTFERTVITPVSASVSSSIGSYHPPISEFDSVSIGSPFRNCPTGTALMPMTSPQPMYYSQTLCYSPFLILPPGSDGVVRVDSVGSLHSNSSMDFSANIFRPQLFEDSRTSITLQVEVESDERPIGIGERMPHNAGNHKGTPQMEGSSQKSSTGDLQDDILNSDLRTHEKQLLRSKEYSNADFPGPNPRMKFQQVPQVWEGSTRFQRNLGSNIQYPFVVPMPLFPSHDRTAEGMHPPRSFPVPDSVDTLHKSKNGTGTFFPKPEFSSRERVGSGSRGGNQHGAHSQQDRKHREGTNHSHTSRNRSLGQSRGQHNKHEPRTQNIVNPLKSPAADLERNINSLQQTTDRRGSPPLSTIPAPTNQTTSSGSCTVNSNGHPRTGTGVPGVILPHNTNDATTGHPPQLEFGSLGPF